MKHIILYVSLLFLCFTTLFSQGNEKERELIEILENQKPIPSSIFLNTTNFQPMKLVSSNNWRHIWNDVEDSIKTISQIYDIRVKFDSNKEATQFQKEFIKINSENGIKHRKHGIKFKGANAFYVFTGNEKVNSMMKIAGLQAYCLLFVVDNYFVKLYITTKTNTKVTHFQPLIDEAISKIKNANSNN